MKKQQGFTLIELLVVIAIIGLLSTLAVVALNSARMKARDAQRVSNVKQIQTALELYINDYGNYPDSISSSTADQAKFKNFMPVTPKNPSPADLTDGLANTDCQVSDGDTNYRYAQTAVAGGTLGTSYTITYCLGGSAGSISGTKHIATPSGLVND
jgi:general secretion pathway protein G